MNVLFLMIDEKPFGGQSQRALAANLRRLRIARNLSLSELARTTGLSKATVSGLESARANPTLETIEGLARGLRVSLGELLEAAPLKEIRVVRAGSEAGRPRGRGDARARELDVLADLEDVQITELVLAPQARDERPAAEPSSRAHVYVLEGRLVAGPAGRPTELGAGDYGSFPLDLPFACEAGFEGSRALLLAPPVSPS